MAKLFLKNSNLCDHNSPTSQTDGRTTCDRNTALCTKVHRAVKTVTGALYKVFRPNVQSQMLCTEQCNVGMSKVSRRTVHCRYRNVFSCRRNGCKDVAVLIDAGRPFQARDAATGNARSPIVDRFVIGTTSVSVTDERRRRRPSVSAHRRRLSARYDGAVP